MDDENAVNTWGVFTEDATDNMYHFKKASASDVSQKLHVENVLKSAQVYVLTNTTDVVINETDTPLTDGLKVSDSDIKTITEKVKQENLDAFNSGLQAYVADNSKPLSFGGKVMLMSGSASIDASTPYDAPTNTYSLMVPIKRQYARVLLTLDAAESGKNLHDGISNLVVHSVESIKVSKVCETILPYAPSAPKPSTSDAFNYDFSNVDSYKKFTMDDVHVDGILAFYVTPNSAAKKTEATSIQVKANVSYTDKFGNNHEKETRYYRAVVSDAKVGATAFSVDANGLYQ